MIDYNDLYTKSLLSGATPDDFGNVQHTPASLQTLSNLLNQEQHQPQFMHIDYNKHPSLWDTLFGKL